MDEEIFFKCFGVLWEPVENFGEKFLADNPFCPTESCHTPLDQKIIGTDSTGHYERGWNCCKCGKNYRCPEDDYRETTDKARKIYRGYQKAHYKIYSLDLPPTKVIDEAEDENYWVQARISEKDGKRMAVIYFGEKIKGKQSKKDYSQVFLDFEDEQLRFDKGNKNPMKILSKLTAEFPDSLFVITKKDDEHKI